MLGGELEDFGLDGLVDDLFVGHGASAQIGNLRYMYYRFSWSSALVLFFVGYDDFRPD